MAYTITIDQADTITTIATLNDLLAGRGGNAVTDEMRAEYLEQRRQLRESLAPKIRSAFPGTGSYRGAVAWLNAQNIAE